MAQERNQSSFPCNAPTSDHIHKWLQLDTASLPVSCSLLMPQTEGQCHFVLPVKDNQAETVFLLHS